MYPVFMEVNLYYIRLDVQNSDHKVLRSHLNESRRGKAVEPLFSLPRNITSCIIRTMHRPVVQQQSKEHQANEYTTENASWEKEFSLKLGSGFGNMLLLVRAG